MEPRFLAFGLGLLVATAGCIGPGTTEPSGASTVAPTADASAIPAADAVHVLTWEGYIRAGGTLELPAHFKATEPVVAPVWNSGFNLLVEELPSVVEIRFEWTAASPTEVMYMAHVANDYDDHRQWVEYESTDPFASVQWPSANPQCMRIPTDDVAPGHWHIMAHSRYGADIELKFTITAVGGVVTIPGGLHGHEADLEEVEQGRELVPIVGGEAKREWLPCELSGDDVSP